jgi:hypothetical protein
MWIDKLWYRAISLAAVLGAIALVIAAVVVVVGQAGVWLKTAVWPSLPFGNVLTAMGWTFNPSGITALGVQKIVIGFLELPASLIFFALAFPCGWLSVWASRKLDELSDVEFYRYKNMSEAERERHPNAAFDKLLRRGR